MKTLLLLILVLNTSLIFSQLSSIDSEKGSGKLYEDSGRNLTTVLDYDISKSEIGFSANWNKKTPMDRCLNSRSVWSIEPTIALNEQTFTIFNGGLKPGFGLNGGYTNLKYCDKSNNRISGFNRFVLHFSYKSTLIKNAVVIGDTLLETNKKWGQSLNLNIGWGHVHEVPDPNNNNQSRYSWSIGFNIMPGYDLNSASHLDEALFCKTTGNRLFKESDSSYYNRMECNELFDGEFKNTAFVTFATIFKKKIKSLDDSQDDNYIDLIIIPKLTVKQSNLPRYDLAMGFGFNKFPRTVTSTLLFEAQNFGTLWFKEGTKLSDVFSANLYFGIPLGK